MIPATPPSTSARSLVSASPAKRRVIEIGSAAKEQSVLHHQEGPESERLANLVAGQWVYVLAKDGLWKYAKFSQTTAKGIEIVVGVNSGEDETRIIRAKLCCDYLRIAENCDDAATSVPDCPGVSLDALRYIQLTHNIQDDMSTAFVIKNFVTTATSWKRECYVNLLQRHDPTFVAHANCMISHAWACNFNDVKS